jgi:hypothetical protein
LPEPELLVVKLFRIWTVSILDSLHWRLIFYNFLTAILPQAEAMTQQSQHESTLRKFLYLSRLPAAGWLQTPAQYQLSLHVGEDARNDPPSRPGVYATASVRPGSFWGVGGASSSLFAYMDGEIYWHGIYFDILWRRTGLTMFNLSVCECWRTKYIDILILWISFSFSFFILMS